MPQFKVFVFILEYLKGLRLESEQREKALISSYVGQSLLELGSGGRERK